MKTFWKVVCGILIACILLWALSFLFIFLVNVLKIVVVIFLITFVIAGIKSLIDSTKND
jgi:predicted tellurium resistance membrane protein TerC